MSLQHLGAAHQPRFTRPPNQRKASVTDFDAATNNSSLDMLVLDVATINGLIGLLSDTSDNDVAATDDPVYVALTTDGQTVTNATRP